MKHQHSSQSHGFPQRNSRRRAKKSGGETNLSPVRTEINTDALDGNRKRSINTLFCVARKTIRKIKPKMIHSQSSFYLICEQHLSRRKLPPGWIPCLTRLPGLRVLLLRRLLLPSPYCVLLSRKMSRRPRTALVASETMTVPWAGSSAHSPNLDFENCN